MSTKNHIPRKSLYQFSKILDVKHKTGLSRIDAAKAKRKAIKTGNMLWSNIAKRLVHT